MIAAPDGVSAQETAVAHSQTQIAFSVKDDIYVMRADGTELKRLTTSRFGASSPVWSPDGKEIAFAVNRPEMLSSMHLMAADGTNERNVANDARPLAWSPDGKSLLIGDEIHFVDRDGRSRFQLTTGAWAGLLSTDGKSVFYRSKTAGQSDIYRVDIDGTNRRQVTKDVGNVGSFSLSTVPGAR